MNSLTIKHDFLIPANNPRQRVIVKMNDRDVDSARNMASIEETPVVHACEDCIAFEQSLRGRCIDHVVLCFLD